MLVFFALSLSGGKNQYKDSFLRQCTPGQEDCTFTARLDGTRSKGSIRACRLQNLRRRLPGAAASAKPLHLSLRSLGEDAEVVEGVSGFVGRFPFSPQLAWARLSVANPRRTRHLATGGSMTVSFCPEIEAEVPVIVHTPWNLHPVPRKRNNLSGQDVPLAPKKDLAHENLKRLVANHSQVTTGFASLVYACFAFLRP